MGPGEKWGTAVAPEVGTAPGARSRRRSTFLLRQKSRAAFQGWRRGAGEAAQFLARHQAAANIHSVSALLPGGGASWCSSCEGKEWLAPWMAWWWMVARLAPWRQLPVCPATLHHHPTFLFIFPQMPAPPLTRTQAEHIRSACEACCARPCYADPPMVPWHHHTKLEKVLLMGTGRWGLGAGN